MALTLLFAPEATAGETAFHHGSVLRFATKKEALQVLTQRDRYLNNLSRFDRQSRLGVAGDPSLDQFVAHIEAQVLDWKDTEIEVVIQRIISIQKRLEPYKIPFPPTILLVKSTGRDESNAAYCRSHGIVLPQSYLKFPERQLERVLIHELFHIVSNHSPKLVRSFYSLIGFEHVPEIQLPASLRDRKITNPDAPLIDCVIQLEVAGKQTHLAPILYANVENFDPANGASFFRYLTFRLMVVEQHGERWLPLETARGPTLLSPTDLADFRRKVGDNTEYLWHPEEILADNFVHLVMETPNLPTPRIVEGLRQSFAATPLNEGKTLE